MKLQSHRIALFAVFASACLANSHPKIAADLEGRDPGSAARVIVQFAQAPQTRHLDKARQHGGQVHSTLPLVNGAVVTMQAGALADLADDPEVVRISPDRELSGTLHNAVSSVNYPPVDSYIGSTNGMRGYGVGIAYLDSGIYAQHINFNMYMDPTSRIVYSESFIDSTPDDQYGHGTHVAGIATGMDNADMQQSSPSRDFWGLAPDASIINLKVLDANGKGTDSAVIAAINRAIQLKRTYNIRVMNLSLGRPIKESYKTDPLCQAVEKAWKAGIVVVVAAGNLGRDNSFGNSGYATITAPGNDPYVITVGASNSNGDTDRANDLMTTYSSKGPALIDHVVKPDIVAPGNRVVSYKAPAAQLTAQYPSNVPATSYYLTNGTSSASPYFFTLSGTSMAAPLVSGFAALMIQYDSSLTPDQVKARMMKNAWRGFPASSSIYDPATATTYKVYNDAFTTGAGMLDCKAAFFDSSKPSGSAASPVAYYDSASKSVKLNLNSVGATTVVWGTTSPYATSLVWGTNVQGSTLVWGSAISGTSLVWGTSTMSGFSLVWGTTSPNASSLTPAGESLTVAIKGE